MGCSSEFFDKINAQEKVLRSFAFFNLANGKLVW